MHKNRIFPYFDNKVKNLNNIIIMIIIIIIIIIKIIMIMRKVIIKKMNKKKRYILLSCNLFQVEGQYHYYLPFCFECLNETSHALVNT